MEIDKLPCHIILLDPKGDKGSSIPSQRYNSLKEFILSRIEFFGELKLEELVEEARGHYGTSNRDALWDLINVKVDLETRGYYR